MSNYHYSKINIAGTIALAIASLLFLVMTSCGSDKNSPREQKLAQMSAEQRLKEAKRLYAGGVRLVPSQMKPGTYVALVPKNVFLCYWARLRDTKSDYNSIIINGFQKPGRHVYVTVQASDAAFESKSCGTWKEITN